MIVSGESMVKSLTSKTRLRTREGFAVVIAQSQSLAIGLCKRKMDD